MTTRPAVRRVRGSEVVANRDEPHDFQVVAEDEYVLRVAGSPITFELDRIRRAHGELHGQLTLRTTLPDARTYNGVVSVGTLNLSSPTARRTRATELAQLLRANDVDLRGLLEEFAIRVLDAQRSGSPAIALRDHPKPTPDDNFNVDGFRFPKLHPSILFGDGGTLKSYLAMMTACRACRAGLRVGFFDWELDAGTHRERLERLAGDNMPDGLLYVRCERPLVYEVDRLRHVVRDRALDYVILDSVAFGTDGPPESAEAAMHYARAVRQLGVGSLWIAHITKGENGDQRPFGSTFWHNSARCTWFAKQVSEDQNTVIIGLLNRKSNLGPRLPAVAFEVTFTADRTTFTRVDAASVDELAASLPLWQRLQAALRTTPQTLGVLAEDLGANAESLDRIVRRHKSLFTKVSGTDGITRIALVERRTA